MAGLPLPPVDLTTMVNFAKPHQASNHSFQIAGVLAQGLQRCQLVLVAESRLGLQKGKHRDPYLPGASIDL